MSKPQSVKIEPWVDFPKQPFTIFTDDFVHTKLATFKLNAKGENSSANVKVVTNCQKQGHFIQEEAKLWFALKEGRAIFTKFKTDYLKLHFDNGISECWGSKWNYYASLNANKSINNVSLRLGAHFLNNNVNSDNRIKVDTNGELTWYNRTVYSKDKIRFGSLTALGFNRKLLAKNSFFFGYRLDEKSHFFVRAQNEGFRKDSLSIENLSSRPHQIFDHFNFDFVSSYQDSLKYGVEATFGTTKNIFREALLVLQHETKNNLVSKIRLSTNFDVSAVFKFPSLFFEKIGTTSIGLHGSNLISEKRQFKYGFQLEINA